MAKNDLAQVVQPAVMDALHDGFVTHLLLLVQLPDGGFTWSSDEELLISDAQAMCKALLDLTMRPRPRSCRKGCGR
jgi:hypothetical protein